MHKVVINKCYGGFGLSEKAVMLYAEYAGFPLQKEGFTDLLTLYYKTDADITTLSDEERNTVHFSARDIDRDDPILVRVVEELGSDAGDRFAELKIVEIPEDVKWTIEEYDGMEWVSEVHRTWS
jgi:hypothetical protein